MCQFCGENYITRLHRCEICSVIGQICMHTSLKCANCSGNHRANSMECETVQAVRTKSSSPVQNNDMEEEEL